MNLKIKESIIKKNLRKKGVFMAYLLVVLTFLASILFYSFYPRSDAINLVDKPEAQSLIFELVAQHSAAVQAATTRITPIKQDAARGRNRMRYEMANANFPAWPKFFKADPNADENAEKPGLLSEAQYSDPSFGIFMPDAVRQYNLRPQSLLLCVNNQTAKASAFCGNNTSDFIITIMSLDAIGSEYGPRQMTMLERALGESTFLANYDHNMLTTLYDSTETKIRNKAHLTTNCGIVASRAHYPSFTDEGDAKAYDPYNAEFVLSNTRGPLVTLPRTFTNNYNVVAVGDTAGKIGDRTHLLCITELKLTYVGCCNERNWDNVSDDLADEASCNAVNCSWSSTDKRCTCSPITACGTASDGKDGLKYGCRWNNNACVSACEQYTSSGTCNAAIDIGCVWYPKITPDGLSGTSGECKGTCGDIVRHPVQSSSQSEL